MCCTYMDVNKQRANKFMCGNWLCRVLCIVSPHNVKKTKKKCRTTSHNTNYNEFLEKETQTVKLIHRRERNYLRVKTMFGHGLLELGELGYSKSYFRMEKALTTLHFLVVLMLYQLYPSATFTIFQWANSSATTTNRFFSSLNSLNRSICNRPKKKQKIFKMLNRAWPVGCFM